MKPHCNICSNKTIGVCKGFVSRTMSIYSQKCLAQEINFLINVYAENGHNITDLEKVSSEYKNNIFSIKEEENIDGIKNDKNDKIRMIKKDKSVMGTETWRKVSFENLT